MNECPVVRVYMHIINIYVYIDVKKADTKQMVTKAVYVLVYVAMRVNM